jgi:hypothetical protein
MSDAVPMKELDRPFRAPICSPRKPRALPWATISRAVGAPIHGAPMGSRRWFVSSAPKGHAVESPWMSAARQWFDSSAPKGQSIAAQGNALGHGSRKTRALKGRPNTQRALRQIRPPFQGFGLLVPPTQGVALGCDSLGLWPAEPQIPDSLLPRAIHQGQRPDIIVAQGNALGLDRGHTEALKGRPNLCGASSPSGNRLSQREEGMA